MFLCSNMDSPQKTGLDTSQTIPFGGCHPILISATIIDLAILKAAVRICMCELSEVRVLLYLHIIHASSSQLNSQASKFICTSTSLKCNNKVVQISHIGSIQKLIHIYTAFKFDTTCSSLQILYLNLFHERFPVITNGL